MHKSIAIAGIHTGIGKTIVSAIIAKALEADYWKPVQAGSLEDTDTMTVQKLTGTHQGTFHPERFRLAHALSPHTAAALEGTTIRLTDFTLPETSNTLIVETAGGLMSPLNDQHTMLDLVVHLALPVILVSSNYLGSINHTMLTIEVLKTKNIPVTGIIFCGETNASSEEFILQNTRLPLITSIPFSASPDAAFVASEAVKMRIALNTISSWKH